VDILADFVIYAGFPVALVVGAPSTGGYLSLAFLLACFYLNTASWMYLAAILEKRKYGAIARACPAPREAPGTGEPSRRSELTTITMPAGLIGGTETIIFYSLFLLWPAYLVPLYSLMAGMVLITIGQRLLWASRYLQEATVTRASDG
jgi:hypothetical protein